MIRKVTTFLAKEMTSLRREMLKTREDRMSMRETQEKCNKEKWAKMAFMYVVKYVNKTHLLKSSTFIFGTKAF